MAIVLVLAAAACGGDGGGGSDGGAAAAPLGAAETGAPFAEPALEESRDGRLQLELVAADRTISVAGSDVEGRAYGDALLGPTLVVDPGDTIDLTLDNQLDAHTNIHFHGLHVSPERNGDNIFLSVEPGETFAYSLQIPDDHPPGTFWYHSHAHGISEEQVFGGLSGVILISGLNDLLPSDLRGVDASVIALKDAQATGDTIEAKDIDSNAPTLRTVNDLHQPVKEIAPGEVQLWHLANIGADIWYDVELEGTPMTVVGEDGNPVWEVTQAHHLVLPPGKRYEVLVTGPAEGDHPFRTRRYDQQGDVYPATDLMTVRSRGRAETAPAMPTSLIEPRPIPAEEVAERRTFTFSERDDQNRFFINGREFDADRVDVRPRLGTVEEWTLRNTSTEQHPFHIHVNDFEVISVGGEPYEATGVQDTVALLPGKDVVMRTRFTDFPGRFVFHCHILNHEDNGMMAVVEVVE
jgi:FtsP/CotA-like multicopper oxidase with cupredoxin domain